MDWKVVGSNPEGGKIFLLYVISIKVHLDDQLAVGICTLNMRDCQVC